MERLAGEVKNIVVRRRWKGRGRRRRDLPPSHLEKMVDYNEINSSSLIFCFLLKAELFSNVPVLQRWEREYSGNTLVNLI